MVPSASFIDVKNPVITRPAIKKVSRTFSELPQSLIHSAKVAQRVTFNPCMHLNFHSRNNLYNGPNRAKRAWRSPHAATEPFPLFTQKAIAQSSAEIFDEEVIAECQHSSTFDKHMVRGVGPACIFPIQPHLTSTPNTNRRVPFKYDSWKAPEVMARTSKVAGIDLVLFIDFEMPTSASQPEPERELKRRTRQTNKPCVRRTPRHRLALRQLHIRMRGHAFQLHRHSGGKQR